MISIALALALAAAPKPPPMDKTDGPGSVRPAPDAGTAPTITGQANADVKDAAGKSLGKATLVESSTGVLLTVQLSGLTPGAHGMHFHDKGKCEGPKFDSAGPHFNPTGAKHGVMTEGGGHAGDLPNVHAGADGKGAAEVFLKGAKLKGDKGLLDADGSALVVHAKADDYATDPSGSSGDRIGCAELK